jgi:hypothetical protein
MSVMSEGDDSGFASRWSERKAAARREESPPDEAADSQEEAAPRDDFENMEDAEILRELGLPDPETLGAGADFKAFMTGSVPGHIRSRALRQLWRSNPLLANVDGLVDYGGDFTDSATVVENLQTAYEVGRGFARKLTELADSANESDPPAADGEHPLDPDEPDAEVAGTSEAGLDGIEPEAALPSENARTEELVGDAPAPKQRMRFSFDGDSDASGQVS